MLANGHPLDALGDPTRRQVFELLRGGPAVGRRARRRAAGEEARGVPAPARPRGRRPRRAHEARDEAPVRARRGRGRELRDWVDGFWDEALARFKAAAESRKEVRHERSLVIEVVRKTSRWTARSRRHSGCSRRTPELVAGGRRTRSTETRARDRLQEREGGEVYEISTNGEKGHWATVTRLGAARPARARLEHPRARRPTRPRSRCAFSARGRRHARRARAPRLGERRRGGPAKRRELRHGLGRTCSASYERPARPSQTPTSIGLRGRPVQEQLADESREAAGREHRVRRLQLLERPPANAVIPSVRSSSQVSRGAGSNDGHAHEVVALGLTVPAPPRRAGRVGPRPDERAELEARRGPASSASSRRSASSSLSPCSIPPPGVAHTTRSREVEAHEQRAVVIGEDDRPRGGPQARAVIRAKSRSARNQRSRSSHGTAALAGEVDGSTKSAVSPSRRSWSPCSGRSPKTPLYAALPTNAITAGRA